ncbi:Starch-binding associating with outer membrane [Pedobacter sp. ok626]|uniref:RagB/SusD family nutrient uptake outer membrane protein n=1 Tax=Pedobacter sp. ok626 TaxID=1761882 RepID=UPI00088BEA6A|nr:RagB/SusD family nutrient uptake outer membrane protein [Pedobacter sp. ok626]SDK00993.1 Starch-binding associating with outer membrane [Pedobacter sp. ok626]
MKKITFFILTIMVLASSCNKLDTNPTEFLSPVNYYQTEQQLSNALNGVYDPLGSEAMYGNALLTWLSYGNDEAYWAFSAFIIPTTQIFNYDSSNSDINGLWTALYDGINRANILLEALDKASIGETAKKSFKGQALFLRAYYYFMLVDNWGGVPLKLSSTKSANEVDIPRTDVKVIYDQILKDMQTAEELLPLASTLGANSSGRISKNAVQGILARVCLTMAGSPINDVSKYADALKWSKKVIDQGQNSLNPDFAQIFTNQAQDKYDIQECIWEVEFYGNQGDSHRETGFNGIRNGNRTPTTAAYLAEPGFGYGFLGITGKLFGLYAVTDPVSQATKDLRRDRSIANYTWANTAIPSKTIFPVTTIWGRYPGKWRREEETFLPRNKNACGTNFPLLRYADVLLMYAEAENQINGPTTLAYEAINKVRQRAYGNGSRVATITINNAGSGYTAAPEVTIAAGTASYTATATATITAGKVTAITITSPGGFYNAVPIVSIAAPTGTGGVRATATATIETIIASDANLVAGLDQKDFFTQIQNERMRELSFECLRTHDLKRWGTLITTLKDFAIDVRANAPAAYKSVALLGENIQDKHTLYPIPSRELSLNAAITQKDQNPGW